MEHSLTDTFNELQRLSDIQQRWGMNIKDHLPEEAYVAFGDDLRKRPPEQYTAEDHEAFTNMVRSGVDSVGYEAGVDILNKTLQEGERNIAALLSVIRVDFARSFMPALDNPEEVRALTVKHQLPTLRLLI